MRACPTQQKRKKPTECSKFSKLSNRYKKVLTISCFACFCFFFMVNLFLDFIVSL